MLRLFVGLELPDHALDALSRLTLGIPGARFVPPANYHLTLRFIGEVDERQADDIDSALAEIAARAFPLALAGVGVFGDRQPRSLYAGVARSEALERLQAKVETHLQRIGLAPESRRFTPHVTLAKLRNPPRDRLGAFLSTFGDFALEPFLVTRFTLYSSILGHEGSHYTPERHYVL